MNVSIEEILHSETIDYLLSPAGDEVLAYYAVTSVLPRISFPEGLGISLVQIEQCIKESPLLRIRFDYLQQRIVALAQSHDPVAQFERVAGYSLQGVSVLHQCCLV